MSLLLHLVLLFQPYSRLNCAEFVSFNHQHTVREIVSTHSRIDRPYLGALVVYGPAHVGLYINRDWVFDSTPEHGVSIHRIPAHDMWYSSPKYYGRARCGK